MDYSPVEHLAKTPWIGAWKDGRLGMFTAVFDASGTEHDKPVMVVAGFAASSDAWSSFESEWKKRLAADQLSCFHMNKFAQSKGDFKEWEGDEPRRRRLLSDLHAI